MKLHWSPRSPFVRKVMIAAHELGVADRLDLVRTVVAMTQVNPDLRADNPLNKIPTLLLDDGTAVFDSLVICEYLDSLAGPRLFPTGAARWTALTWHALGTGLLDLLILWRNERDKPAERRTAVLVESFSAKATATLDRLAALAPALVAAPFGIGHIGVGCALGYVDFRFAELGWRDRRPALAAWERDFAARPSVLAAPVGDG